MKSKNERITSIDALRGMVLLGILLVHCAGGFGYGSYFSNTPFGLNDVINIFLSKRCAPIFSTLFGISFYLILRKGNYSSLKFFWRCCVLILFGLINKFFYTYDALMWYGMCGILLIPFRNVSTGKLVICTLFFYFLSIGLSDLNIGDFLIKCNIHNRYEQGGPLTQVISYPLVNSVKDYLYISLQSGIFGTFSYFLFGYYLAKVGVIENLKSYICKFNIKNLSLIALCIATLLVVYYLVDLIYELKMTYIRRIAFILSFIFYAIVFIYIYYRIAGKGCKGLEAYGKLGLTNYSMQGIFGVIVMNTLVIPNSYSFNVFLIICLIFYLFQSIFSVLWLKVFKYGPLEYIWRSLTNLNFSSPLK